MQTTQQWYSVDLKVKNQIVGTTEIMADSPKQAAEIVGSMLNLKAKKSYMKISPRSNGVIIKENTMINENINDTQDEPQVTSMHEVTPEDKETQEVLEDVQVGEVVPMVPGEANVDKGLRPDLA